VDFSFSEDQLAFADAVRDLLGHACPPEAVRAAWSGAGPGYDPELWRRLGDMGVLGVLAPPESGGLGLSEVDLVRVLEESGRAALPAPLVEHAAVAVPLLAAAGRDDLVRSAVAGEAVVTFSDRADRVGWAEESSHLLVADRGEVRLLAPLDVTTFSAVTAVDRSQRAAAVGWSGGEVLAGADLGLAVDRAALGAAAQLCGLAAHLIDMTVDYVRQRHQFGAPIGSFQAIKHHLANALLSLEHARPAVYRAAWTVAHQSATHESAERGRDVSMAKVMAGDAADLAGRTALQCHGAIGYTWEHDLHLWLKRVWVLERAWGGTARHRARVADAVIGPRSARDVGLGG